jgi:hypothetical protein
VLAGTLTVTNAIDRGRLPAALSSHGASRQGGAASSAVRRPPAALLREIPPFYVALGGRPIYGQVAMIRATATGETIATITPPRPYGLFTWATGAADDRAFVLTAQRLSARGALVPPTTFFLLRFDPATGAPRLSAMTFPMPSWPSVTGIALSPDGTKLAVALSGVSPAAGNGVSWTPRVVVYSLPTRSRRQWVWPGPGAVGNLRPVFLPLSWTADGRRLAFKFWPNFRALPSYDGSPEIRVLDTASPGGDLRSSTPVPGGAKPSGMDTLITPDGTKIVMFAGGRLEEISTASGKPVGRQSWPKIAGSSPDVVWTNSSGSMLIVAAWDLTHTVLEVATSHRLTRLPTGPGPQGFEFAW